MGKLFLISIVIALLFPVFSMAVFSSEVFGKLTSMEVIVVEIKPEPQDTEIERLEYLINKLFELVKYYRLQIAMLS